MAWPYQFIHGDVAVRHARRVSLDRYALYVQVSPWVLILAFVLVRPVRYAIRKWITRSKAKPPEDSATPWVMATLNRVGWWLGNPVELLDGWNLGRRDELIFGGVWMAWLLFSCVNETGHDYFLLTKKFGIIGTSQLPLQYLLASKRVNPVAFAFRVSHEEINRWHRALGWICYFLILLHGAFYLNYYIQVGGLTAALFRPVPALGVLGLLGMTLLSTTTLGVLRRYSYRIFYLTHLVVALSLPVVIWFHVPHGRVYMAESFLVLLVDISVRRFASVKCPATIETAPNANIISVKITLPPAKISQFASHPASYLYLSIPSRSHPGRHCLSSPNPLLALTENPFTVAAVNEEARELTLIARRMKGPMTKTLTKLASLHAPDSPRSGTLGIDGPYGAAVYFPQWATFDTVLLIAGGVGATFVVPLYQQILREVPAATTRVEFVWAVGDVSETACMWPRSTSAEGTTVSDGSDERKIRLFITGSKKEDSSSTSSSSRVSQELEGLLEDDDDLEMTQLDLEKSGDSSRLLVADRNIKTGVEEQYGRPDLQKIVDGVFSQSRYHRVAVVVCGPPQMARDVRMAMGDWVRKGRDVWFHSEGFGW
ncbi:ferric reductase NAD binding domain-containing protein [Lasiosphaeris hirsuta]|uniref:Ferric reductase NAD binding domain-containing protein n=1 Tax=Lasiosphaeris hirsuta TaxID=260670 RepID=A0AA40AYL6_9PEZI|nr:ferric reductase NAD binding domain-containing protein [Lasiosphaeris hirsuta]